MLVLSRKIGERIRIASDIDIVVRSVRGDRIQLGIEAPREVRIRRAELPSSDSACRTTAAN